ncbi:MAG: SDR family oxidoreductase [Acidimicrobiaceae bacterium]|nr:SDR family oxidoreductase [Acidimicrobiaceae bacterium]
MTSNIPIAFVTGASRGIGRCAALALAEAGYDVALSARTVREGEGRSEASSVRDKEPIVVLPGSLESTAADIEARGRRALIVPMDVLDQEALLAAPRTVLDEWGRIDVLVNNAIYQAGGTLDRFLDLTREGMINLVAGNYVHQVLLTQAVLPAMLDAGSGRVINMVSASARIDPPAPAGEGGWGIAYSASKAAFGRVAGGINAEFSGRGVVAFNVDPGNVITEKRRALRPDDPYEDTFGAAPAEATGQVIAWLASSPDAQRFLGKWVYAPKLCADLGLLPGWAGEST